MKVLLIHTGSKRGGWNVQWWLKSRNRDGFLNPEKAVSLGFKAGSCWDSGRTGWATMGPFATRAEAEAKARELGLESITPQKLVQMKRSL